MQERSSVREWSWRLHLYLWYEDGWLVSIHWGRKPSLQVSVLYNLRGKGTASIHSPDREDCEKKLSWLWIMEFGQRKAINFKKLERKISEFTSRDFFIWNYLMFTGPDSREWIVKFPSMNVPTIHPSASTTEFARMITTRLRAIVWAVPQETISLVLYLKRCSQRDIIQVYMYLG